MDTLNQRTIELFEEYSSVYPKRSKNEGAAADFVVNFAKKNGLEFVRQSGISKTNANIHNVVVKKAASAGYEHLPAVVLQAHLDMVCVTSVKHDFDKEPLKLVFDKKRGLLSADGTSLGADDGIGVAMILAVLEDRTLNHPALEAVFTSDEESGMSGAASFDTSLLSGKTLINIDSEDEGVFYFGCAGGVYAKAYFDMPQVAPKSRDFYRLKVSGLRGGHSGLVIHEGRANANVVLARLLHRIIDSIEIADICGGTFTNAIASEATAVIGTDDLERVLGELDLFRQQVLGEYSTIDDGLSIDLCKAEPQTEVFSDDFCKTLTSYLINIPYGVLQMSKAVSGLVQTSNNLGIIKRENDRLLVHSFIRSAVGAEKNRVLEEIKALSVAAGAEFVADVNSPEWTPNPNSPILKLMSRVYLELFDTYPKHEAIHAGLECGHFSRFYPDMDLISIGPTIKGAHTPKETLYLDTLPKVVAVLKKTLQEMKS